MANYDEIDINGNTCVFTPIPAIPMLKIAHRFGQALAREKALVGVVAGATKAVATTSDKVSEDEMKVLLGFVETVFLSVDEKLLNDLLSEAAGVVRINPLPGQKAVNGVAVFSAFDGDVSGLVTCLYHVLRVSGFFGMLRGKV